MLKSVKVLALVPFLIFAQASLANNPSVEAGEAGYITYSPMFAFWLKKQYASVIVGPTSYGYSPFHYEVQAISIQDQTFDEVFQIIDANQIKIHFEVHFLMRPNPEPLEIKRLVEHFAGAKWYDAVVKEPLRTFVRDAIGTQDSQTLSSSQDAIQNKVNEAAQRWIKEKNVPVILDQVSVGNFQFPDAISEAAAEKQANLQKLQAKSTLLEIAKKDAEIEAAKAEGIRRSQDIINQTLTPIYVQHEMVEAIKEIATKQGNSIIYVPMSSKDGLPLIGNATVQPVNPQSAVPQPARP